MDVHGQTIEYSVRRPGETEPSRFQSPHSAQAVRTIFGKLRRSVGGPIRACYEAGPTGFELCRLLRSEGIDCVVIAPSLIPTRPGDRCKTDRKDARHLREMDEAGKLVEVQVPTREEEAARSLTRQLEKARHGVVRAKLRISSNLLRLSLSRPAGEPWTKAHRAWLDKLQLAQPIDQIIHVDNLAELQHCEERMRRLERHVEVLADTKPFAEKVRALRCFRGIETATAMGIATELLVPVRFRSAREVMAYAGLGICESSSGESRWQGGITKTGNAHLRRHLVRAARHAAKGALRESKGLAARRKDAPDWAIDLGRRAQRRLHEKHARMQGNRKHPNVIAAAVARELAGWTWAALVRSSQLASTPSIEVDADGVPAT
jgi:transposase